MKPVKQLRYTPGYHELFGRKATLLRAVDGFKMFFNEANGFVYITSSRDDGMTALVHGMNFECIVLEPEASIEKPLVLKEAKAK